jgi:hypothetical protein
LKRAAVILLLTFAGCASESAPPPNESMTAPELSHPREPRKGGDPPPPQREDLRKTQLVLITETDPAPVATSSATTHTNRPAPTEQGTVNPLR